MVEYRSRARIILDILAALRGPCTVTRLLQKANLSHPRLKEYLEELRAKGWVQEDDGGWRLTQEGSRVRQELLRVADEMADFGLHL